MLNFASQLKIFAYTPATDMRKGFAGLSAIVREEFDADPTDGSLFVFINRRRDRMKLLHFDGGGFWLYYRLLEAGTFEMFTPKDQSCQLQIDATQLTMLLSGVSLVASQKRRRRSKQPERRSSDCRLTGTIDGVDRGLAETPKQTFSTHRKCEKECLFFL